GCTSDGRRSHPGWRRDESPASPCSCQPAPGLAAAPVGDAVAAEQALGPLGSFVPMTGIVEPGLLRYLPDAIEALIRLGDLEGAATLLDPFESRARDLNRR